MDNIIKTPERIIPETPEPYIVYVQTDEAGRITAVNSSAFVSSDWGTEIDQGYGDKHHHAQGNYFDQPIYTDDGIPCYKLVDGTPVERSEEEIEADRAGRPKPASMLEERVDALETGKADKSEVAAVWDQMAAAYSEGVQGA